MPHSSPAFQFYASDWAHSVSSLTLEERGAYITMLVWSWQHGNLPNDPKRLALIIGVSVSATVRVCRHIMPRWIQHEDGTWFNRKLEAVRREQKDYSERQQAAGIASAKARAKMRELATVVPTTVEPRLEPRLQPRHQPERQPDTQPHPQPDGQPQGNSSYSVLHIREEPETTDQSQGDTLRDKPRAPTTNMLREFDRLHRHYLHKPAVIQGGKDSKLLASLWRSHGEDEVRRLMAAFFVSDDAFIRQAGYTIGVFVSQAGKLIAADAEHVDATDAAFDRVRALAAGRGGE